MGSVSHDEEDENMEHDGIVVTVPDNEDHFSESETDGDGEEDCYQARDQPSGSNPPNLNDRNLQSNTDDDEVAIAMATKKSFLRKELERDPQLKEVFYDMMEDEIQEREQRRRSVTKKANTSTSKANHSQRMPITPTSKGIEIIKSPSDTTIYTPALKKANEATKVSDIINKITNFVESIRMDSDIRSRSTPRTPTSTRGDVNATPRTSRPQPADNP